MPGVSALSPHQTGLNTTWGSETAVSLKVTKHWKFDFLNELCSSTSSAFSVQTSPWRLAVRNLELHGTSSATVSVKQLGWGLYFHNKKRVEGFKRLLNGLLLGDGGLRDGGGLLGHRGYDPLRHFIMFWAGGCGRRRDRSFGSGWKVEYKETVRTAALCLINVWKAFPQN